MAILRYPPFHMNPDIRPVFGLTSPSYRGKLPWAILENGIDFNGGDDDKLRISSIEILNTTQYAPKNSML